MKKTQSIQLLLITATLAGCYLPIRTQQVAYSGAYTDCDTTCDTICDCGCDPSLCYSPAYYPQGGVLSVWRYAFRPYGNYYKGKYVRGWHYSGALHANPITRGGFGSGGAFSVSS